MGFCLFNNVAVAARHALDAHGLRAGADRRLGRPPRQRDQRHLPRRPTRCCSSRSTSRRCIRGPARRRDVGSGAGEGYTVNLPVPRRLGRRRRSCSLVEHVAVPLGARVRAGARAGLGGLRRAPRRPARELRGDRGGLRGDGGVVRGAGRRARRAARARARGRLRPRRAGARRCVATLEVARRRRGARRPPGARGAPARAAAAPSGSPRAGPRSRRSRRERRYGSSWSCRVVGRRRARASSARRASWRRGAGRRRRRRAGVVGRRRRVVPSVGAVAAVRSCRRRGRHRAAAWSPPARSRRRRRDGRVVARQLDEGDRDHEQRERRDDAGEQRAGRRQFGVGTSRVRAASPQFRHQSWSSATCAPQRGQVVPRRGRRRGRAHGSVRSEGRAARPVGWSASVAAASGRGRSPAGSRRLVSRPRPARVGSLVVCASPDRGRARGRPAELRRGARARVHALADVGGDRAGAASGRGRTTGRSARRCRAACRSAGTRRCPARAAR